MRRLLVVSLTAVAFAPAASAVAAPRTGFAFGRSGGNIMPFTVTVAVDGSVRSTGAAPATRRTVTQQQLANLNRVAFVVDFETLPAFTACTGTLPDVAAELIRVGDRTVRVHGACSKRFNRLWTALANATRR